MSDFVVKPYVKFVPAEQDVVAEAAASAAEAKTTANGAEAKIGNLSQLTTTAKTNLVAAINEAAASGGSGANSWTITDAIEGDDDAFEDAVVNIVPTGTQSPTLDDLASIDDVNIGDIINISTTQPDETMALAAAVICKCTLTAGATTTEVIGYYDDRRVCYVAISTEQLDHSGEVH